MKDKLEVGMYAYIKGESRDYGIGKIREIHTNGFAEKQVVIVFKNSTHSVNYSKVIGSFNIKDLIVVGDYVDGEYVWLWKEANYEEIWVGDMEQGYSLEEYPKDIKSIVTKEQMEQMAYKLGE